MIKEKENFKVDFMLVDDVIRNNTSRRFVINVENESFSEKFITKPKTNRNILNRIKHAYHVLSGMATPVYYFEDIQKYYSKKISSYVNFNEKV